MSDNHMYTVAMMEYLYENKITTTKGEIMQEVDLDTVPDICVHSPECTGL